AIAIAKAVENHRNKQGLDLDPGQAPAYFYGSQQLWQLRSQAQEILGQEFTLKKFHNSVLSPGFLTPRLLEQVLVKMR
ncbi:MAG: DUF885 family protein, partial [Cyanobacteria bacterium J06631_2]